MAIQLESPRMLICKPVRFVTVVRNGVKTVFNILISGSLPEKNALSSSPNPTFFFSFFTPLFVSQEEVITPYIVRVVERMNHLEI